MSPTRPTDRRVLVTLVAIATAVAVAGCKKTENPPVDTAAPAVAPAPDTTKPRHDQAGGRRRAGDQRRADRPHRRLGEFRRQRRRRFG
jgi:hypothetical protein